MDIEMSQYLTRETGRKTKQNFFAVIQIRVLS